MAFRFRILVACSCQLGVLYRFACGGWRSTPNGLDAHHE